MIKALLKKQILENFAFLFYGKEGKRRSTGGLVGVFVLVLVLLFAFFMMFFEMGKYLSEAFAAQNLRWLYFAFMGTISVAFGLIGSVFTAKAKLYEAKDNDLLHAMPIPSWLILFSRMVGLYLYTLFFEGLIFLPSAVAYFVCVNFTASTLLASLLVLLFMALGTLAICCVLGWLIALVAAKLPAKKLLTTLLCVAFFVGYVIVYSKVETYLSYVVAHGELVAGKMKTVLYPFYQLGLACTGNWLSLLIFAAMFTGAFALVYLLLSKTYLRLATANRGGKKAKYKGGVEKKNSVFFALCKKELLRFTNNPMVAMNALLGSIFLLLFPFLLLFSEDFRTLFSLLDGELVALILAGLLCLLSSTNMVSACAVSLEGENLWIVRGLPLPTERVLFAKAATHYLLTAIPATFAAVFLAIVCKVPFGLAVCVATFMLLYSGLTALLGLVINLKMPNLHWISELHAVKQSFSAFLAMLLEWGVLGLLVGGYFLFGKYLPAWGYFLILDALLVAVCGLLAAWTKTRGVKIFERL